MALNDKWYEAHAWNNIKPGHEIKINHSISLNKSVDISTLIPLPLDELTRRREESVTFEKSIFEQLAKSVSKWEEQAALTRLLDNALEYINTPAVSHSANQWIEDKKSRHISNAVYKMDFYIYEHTQYNQTAQKQEPVSWLDWSLYSQAPGNQLSYHRGIKIAGQENKRFTDKAAMEKYISGRINAYAHLFTEIFPPVPQEYTNDFMVNGLLLPGYTVADEKAVEIKMSIPERPKESVVARIAADKAARKENRNTAAGNVSVSVRKRSSKNGAELD